jgi:predicted transcriptional regulator
MSINEQDSCFMLKESVLREETEGLPIIRIKAMGLTNAKSFYQHYTNAVEAQFKKMMEVGLQIPTLRYTPFKATYDQKRKEMFVTFVTNKERDTYIRTIIQMRGQIIWGKHINNYWKTRLENGGTRTTYWAYPGQIDYENLAFKMSYILYY